MDKRRQPPEGKKFYGSVTVGERGQVVIPAEARKDFGIQPGDKLLVFADLKTGLWIATPTILEKMFHGAAQFFETMEKDLKADGEQE